MDVPRRHRPRRWPYVLGTMLALGLASAVAAGFDRGAPLPSVTERSVRFATAERGPLVRSVRGPGALIAERTHWLTATTAARVERIHVEAGTVVEPDTVVVKLSNADLELSALEARSELAAAKAELANLEASRETDRLGQQASVAQIRSEHAEAMRVAKGNEALAEAESVAGDELERGRERAEELTDRLKIEKRRLSVIGKARGAQVAAQRARVKQLAAVVAFRERQLADLEIRAGSEGVLQEVAVELGQWANPGTVLAKVVQPQRLKAELRIPEVRARDVRIGQTARIDLRTAEIEGTVTRIDPAVTDGNVIVDVGFEGELPPGARPDLTVDGVVELERLDDVLSITKPANADAGSVAGLFVLTDRDVARRTRVEFGRASVSTIEIKSGLKPGDRVIVSDVTPWQAHDEIRIEGDQ